MNERAQMMGYDGPMVYLVTAVIGILVYHNVVQQSQMTYNLGFVAVIIALFVGVIYELWKSGQGENNGT